MHKYTEILQRLSEIAELLRQGGFTIPAEAVEGLSRLGQSKATTDLEEFERQITTNKYYWRGMGTIEDLAMPTPRLELQFRIAYRDLAIACRACGLKSIYSDDVEGSSLGIIKYWTKRIDRDIS